VYQGLPPAPSGSFAITAIQIALFLSA